MPSLKDLEAVLIRRTSDKGSFRPAKDIQEAQGLWFACPLCFKANGNSMVGTHHVLCWFIGVPLEIDPAPGRWTPSGTSIEDLSLNPSVWLNGEGGCQWHGWVKDGSAE